MQEELPAFVTKSPSGNTYTSRPVTITAIQWDGTPEAAAEIAAWTKDDGAVVDTDHIQHLWDYDLGAYKMPTGKVIFAPYSEHCLIILTLEGEMVAEPGAWIIKGTEGEYYPCKDSVFQAKYSAGSGDTSNQIIPPELRRQLESQLDGPIKVQPRSLSMAMVEADPLTLTGASEPGVEIRNIVLVTRDQSNG